MPSQNKTKQVFDDISVIKKKEEINFGQAGTTETRSDPVSEFAPH